MWQRTTPNISQCSGEKSRTDKSGVLVQTQQVQKIVNWHNYLLYLHGVTEFRCIAIQRPSVLQVEPLHVESGRAKRNKQGHMYVYVNPRNNGTVCARCHCLEVTVWCGRKRKLHAPTMPINTTDKDVMVFGGWHAMVENNGSRYPRGNLGCTFDRFAALRYAQAGRERFRCFLIHAVAFTLNLTQPGSGMYVANVSRRVLRY